MYLKVILFLVMTGWLMGMYIHQKTLKFLVNRIYVISRVLAQALTVLAVIGIVFTVV